MNHNEIFNRAHFQKSQLDDHYEGSGHFFIFGAIDTMVLVITSERIELEGCACAQIEALEEWNGWIYPDDVWGQSETGRNAANTS